MANGGWGLYPDCHCLGTATLASAADRDSRGVGCAGGSVLNDSTAGVLFNFYASVAPRRGTRLVLVRTPSIDCGGLPVAR